MSRGYCAPAAKARQTWPAPRLAPPIALLLLHREPLPFRAALAGVVGFSVRRGRNGPATYKFDIGSDNRGAPLWRASPRFPIFPKMDRAIDEPEPPSLDELVSRMTAYRERAAAARRLAQAISDQHATAGLIKHAEEFEKKAEAIATQIVDLARPRQER